MDWYEKNRIDMAYIKPRTLQKNRFCERFNGSFWRAFLNIYFLEGLTQVRNMA